MNIADLKKEVREYFWYEYEQTRGNEALDAIVGKVALAVLQMVEKVAQDPEADRSDVLELIEKLTASLKQTV